MSQKKLILRAQYNEIQLKFIVNADNSLTFQQLKSILASKLKEHSSLYENIQPQMLNLSDTSNFSFSNSDFVSDLLNNNDLLIVSLKQQNSEKQLSTNPQQQTDIDQQIMQSQQQISEQFQGQLNSSQQQISNQFQAQLKEDPKEAIAVVFDISGSMAQKFYQDPDGTQISRIGAVNAFFSALADKTIAFQLNHIVQLFCFNSETKKMNEFTDEFETFILLVDSLQPGGGTALYDCMNIAIDSLVQIKKQYPKIIPRIIAMTDGEDNSSKFTPEQIVKRLMENKIIVDSFVVGSDCVGLKNITHQSKGKCYYPQDLNQGLKLFEIETILSIENRDLNYEKLYENFDPEKAKNQPFDTEGIAMVKPKEAEKAIQKAEEVVQRYQNNVQASNNIKRIVKEMEDFIKNPIDLVKIFPSQDNLHYWKALLIGPDASIYNQGVYMLSIDFPQNYPIRPPKVNFLTPIYHCNISNQGTSCMDDLLQQNWNPQQTISNILKKLIDLLITPNSANALDSTIASEMMIEPEKYKKNAVEHTIKYASKSVEQILIELMGISVDLTSAQYLEKKQEIGDWIAKFKKSN